MRPLRVYVETSVIGGKYDAEWKAGTEAFFDRVEAGRFRVVVSNQVREEIEPAPPVVRNFYNSELPKMEYLRFVPEVAELAELYLAEKIVTEKYRADAVHVAYATIYNCAGVVSWNYTHLANQGKSVKFNMVNAANGYPRLFIATPWEVLNYETE